MTVDWRRDGRRLLLILIASALTALNIKIFVRTGDLFPGGVTGLTVLIQRLGEKYLNLEIPYTPVNVLLNAFPVYIGFRFIGKKFTLLSLLMILVSGVLVDMIPAYVITYDTLLIAIFGGILGGLAVSLCLRADATSGGTDFIAIYFSQKRGVETWNMVLAFNVVILLVAGYFFGWDKALYSIIFQYVSTQTLHILYRSYQQQTLFIVTDKATAVCAAIHDACHHGATILDAEGSHDHGKLKLVYSVVSGEDIKAAMQAVRDTDPEAFVNSIRSTEIKGHFYMRPKD
ncbi:MAG: YitT family protein [Oscillospiraceae bacterium]|nr:YitT family protein [Oscillospiraceae bacterium]